MLGCAGMAELAAALARRHGLPVVDGVAAAVKLAEALVGLGLATSKLGPYAPAAAQAVHGRVRGPVRPLAPDKRTLTRAARRTG